MKLGHIKSISNLPLKSLEKLAFTEDSYDIDKDNYHTCYPGTKEYYSKEEEERCKRFGITSSRKQWLIDTIFQIFECSEEYCKAYEEAFDEFVNRILNQE